MTYRIIQATCRTFTFCLVCVPVLAQAQMKVETLHIHVLNGRNNKPVKRAHATVNVYPLTSYETPTNFVANQQGDFSMLVPTTAQVSMVIAQQRPCQVVSNRRHKTTPILFPVQQILSSGLVAPNNCSRRIAAAEPGVLTLYVRSAHWWQTFRY